MKPVRVYTTTYCGFCFMATRLLKDRKIPFDEVKVDGDTEARAWLVKITGRRTVPQIFIGDEPIGGYQELAALDASGQLQSKLAD